MDETFADSLCHYGSAIKALGGGKVGGYLVLFGTPGATDLEGDYFTPDTDYGDAKSTPVYYQHGMDAAVGKRKIGAGDLRRDDVGVWIEAQLNLRDEYEKAIYSLAEKGKMGWSSGTAAHLVDREAKGQAAWLKAWPLGLDASITPTPAEPRTRTVPLKGMPAAPALKALLQDDTAAGDAAATSTAGEAQVVAAFVKPFKEQTDMEETQVQDLTTKIDALTASVGALKAKIDAPPITITGAATAADALKAIEVADVPDTRPFKSFGEQLMAAVRAADRNNPVIDKRLYAVKAISGLNETVGSEGGFLVQTDFSAALLERMYETGQIVNRCTPITVSTGANSVKVNAMDETTRVNGSRWGGVTVHWNSEAGQKTAAKPAFRQINMQLHKLTGMCYATDESLEDAAQLESIIMRVFPQEFDFKVEDAIVRGTGAGQPLGVLNSPALVTVAKEAGQAATTILSQNIMKMWARLWARSRANAVWLINQDVEPQLYSMYVAVGVGGIPVFMPAGGLSGSPYATLFGRPVLPVEYCTTVGSVGDVILADFGEYLLAKKGGIAAASSIHFRFDYDETVFRFVLRIDGQPAWAAPLTPFQGSNTLSPFVTLAVRA